MTSKYETLQSPTASGPPFQAAPSSSSYKSKELAITDPAKADLEKKEPQKLVKEKKTGHIKVAVPNLKLLGSKSATSSKAASNNSSPTETLASSEKLNKHAKSANGRYRSINFLSLVANW